MDHDDDGETSYNTFVDDVAFEPTYLQALLTAAGRNVATKELLQNTVPHFDLKTTGRTGSQLYTILGVGSVWVHELMGRIGSGQVKVTHGKLCNG